MADSFERVIDAFREYGCTVIENGDRADVQAPDHSAADRSVSVARSRDRTLVYSHSDDTADVLRTVGLEDADLFDDPRQGITYDYPDGRVVHRSPGKRFRQSGNTTGTALYRQDQLPDDTTVPVYVTEGEQDADAIAAVGGVAVSVAQGAGKAHRADWTPLRGRHVVIVADRDEPGRKHAAQVVEQLADIATTTRIVQAVDGKDAADHLTAGHTLDDLATIAETPPATPPRQSLMERMLTVSELATLTPSTPLIDGLLYRDTLAQLSAAPGSYKTFATIAMSCALAIESTWEGHRIPENRPVVYVAAEGASGVRTRILAWCELTGHKPSDLDGKLYVLPCPIQLGNIVDVTDAIEIVQAVQAGLLVLDTRARCTVGLEENSATEQGLAIAEAERIRAAAGCTVLGVHHSSRAGNAGRGSNAWDGAVWTDLRMEGANQSATITCAKHKDVASGCEHHYRLVPHTVSAELMPGVDEAQRQTLVIVQNDAGHSAGLTTDSDDVVLDIVRTLSPPEGFTPARIIELADERKVKRSTVYAAVKRLADTGKLRNIGTEKRSRYVPVGGA